jgi:hypothetical protein
MSYVVAAPEWLEIDGLPLSTPAWQTDQLDDLLATPEVRGDDILVPYGDGVRPQPRRPTVSKATVNIQIMGDTQPDGTPHASFREGLRLNIAALAWLAGKDGVDAHGTRLATLHLAGATLSGRVHVLRLRFARTGPMYATAQMELSIPAGALM